MGKSNKQDKKIKNKKETEHSSLIVRWVSIVALTITVSFLIFSIIIYTTVSKQALNQQEQTSSKVVSTLKQQLTPINSELQIFNVIPSLSPTTRRILNGGPNISGKDDQQKNAFNDELVSTLSNPDISVAVYNLHDEVVFSNGNAVPAYHSFKGQVITKKKHQNGQTFLLTSQRVNSGRSHRLTGYIVVANRMAAYNSLMHHLLVRMLLISLLAIIVFVIIAFLIVRNVVRPIKEMSQVARTVNHDPNSGRRIKELHRDDELEELATSFNRMLDRMQGYISQQKEFVRDVSHELRTPVAVIQGQLHMLERWGKKDPQILNESITASLQEADRMKHLIQEMLTLTRAEQVSIQYPTAVTTVSDTLQRSVGELRLAYPNFKLRLDTSNLPASCRIQIYHDHLEQVLTILIDNAVKYSTKKKLIIISGRLKNKTVTLSVQDFGIGIPKKEQAKIFHRFYRVDKARTRQRGGNGLGLAIAKKLVTAYQGQIEVHSVPGQGSKFSLSFPCLDKKQAAYLEGLQTEQG